MLSLDDIEAGTNVTHRNTGLKYSVVEMGDEEILLSSGQENLQDLVVPVDLFRQEFLNSDRYSAPRSRRGRRRRGGARPPGGVAPTGPKARGRIKKMVRDRGFGFIRGEDGKEVFFHRSGMAGGDYDNLAEGSAVEYVIQEGPRGARAEHVRAVADAVA